MHAANSKRAQNVERFVLALILVLAFFLRTRDIRAWFVGPDEGMYLYSARVHLIEPGGFHPIRWVKEDVTWVQDLAEHYSDDVETYQHSYLHQLAARYLYRFGLLSLTALRTSSALCGTFMVFVAWWLYARTFPLRRATRIIAAAAIAVHPLLAYYSRTGWGQIGFTAFFLAYFAWLHRALVVVREDDRRSLVRAGIGMCVASILAFGWQENVAPFIVASGVVVLLAPLMFDPPGAPGGYRARLMSRRTWTYVWSAIPVGAATLALRIWSPFAQAKWFNARGLSDMDWPTLKRMTLPNLFVGQRMDLLIGWITIALAALGIAVLMRRDRAFLRHVLVTSIVSFGLIFLLFGEAYIARAYMPIYVFAVLFAAEGAAWLVELGGSTWSRVAIGCLYPASLLVVTWTTLFGEVDSPLFVGSMYMQGAGADVDHRHVDENLLTYLVEHRQPNERVAVYCDKGPIFRLQDVGIQAREFKFDVPRESWPVWILGVERLFEQDKHSIKKGGNYRLIARDHIGRHALYHLEDK